MKNAKNIVANLVGFVVTFAISFFLSPYIVRTLGVEANGLIGLTSNFTNYASVLTVVLSSMAARFITVELRSGRPEAASEFYTAAYANNLLGTALIVPVMALTIVNFGNWFNVPSHLVNDGQLLAALYFANFLLTMVFPRWTVGTWATNNLYLDSIRTMQSVLIRGGLTLLLFVIFKPAVYFVGLAVLIAGIFSQAFSGYYKHRFLPDLRIRPRHLRWHRMRDLWSAGFWNTVNYLGSILSTGFHLLLATTFLGATPMGLLALAMTVPAMAYQMALNLNPVFQPSLAFAYTDGDFTEMQRQAKRAMSITSLLTVLPFAALFAFGDSFFALWVPGQDATLLYRISIVSAAALILSGIVQPLQNVFIITNSQRAHSVASLAMGAANVGLAITLLLATDLGVFAILVAAVLTTAVRALLFTAPMAARRVQAPSAAFLPEVARGLGYLAVVVLLGFGIRALHAPTSWVGFILEVGLMCALGTIANLALLTTPDDRRMVFSVAQRFVRARR